MATTRTANTIETDVPLHESFDDRLGSINQETWGVDFSTPGEVHLAGNSGMKEPGIGNSSGHGYGTYTVNAMLSGRSNGSAIILWPGDNKYPGQEMNLAELTPDYTGNQYSTVHWVNEAGQNVNIITRFSGVESNVFHDYTLVWEPGQITFKVDGVVQGIVTEHVPVDFDNGGMNNTIGFLNNQPNTSMTVRQVDYTPLGITTAPVAAGTGAAVDWEALAAQAKANFAATGHWFYDMPGTTPAHVDPAPATPVVVPPVATTPVVVPPVATPGTSAPATPAAPVDWTALAAEATANFEATGHWFYTSPTAPAAPPATTPVTATPVTPTPVTTAPATGAPAAAHVDWDALAAQATANFNATGHWFYDAPGTTHAATPAAPATAPAQPAAAPVDWYALAAQATANFEATGHWFI